MPLSGSLSLHEILCFSQSPSLLLLLQSIWRISSNSLWHSADYSERSLKIIELNIRIELNKISIKLNENPFLNFAKIGLPYSASTARNFYPHSSSSVTFRFAFLTLLRLPPRINFASHILIPLRLRVVRVLVLGMFYYSRST